MLKRIVTLLIIGGVSLMPIMALAGDIIPTTTWANFYGSVTAYNDNPIPVGSIIDAYDPDGIYCGTDTVDISGKYGFLAVYGDDSRTDDIDEGANPGDSITFYINGRMAVANGPELPVWTELGGESEVNLSASAMLGIESVAMPGDQTTFPGQTVRYYVTVRNTGEGIDFYTISGSTSHGWIIKPMIGFVYALPGGEATIYFDVLIPTAIFHAMTDVVDFRVSSGIDASVYVEGSAITSVEIPTDVGDENEVLLPEGFRLNQNYPNPFNPATTISFDLTSKAAVEFEVFNLLGQTIEHQDLGMLGAGSHSIEFDGHDLASGIYFYRIKVGEGVQVRKMVLMK
nr:T9SS type A sorting domain-containing protein [candidate division Zixibacteria bacterium]